MCRVLRRRSRTLLAASLAIALAGLGAYLHPAPLAGQASAGADFPSIRELREERLATLRNLADLVDQKRRQGSASMVEVASAKREVAEAELETCANQADRVWVLERIVEDSRLLASQVAQLAQNNLASQEVALAMKAELLRSQIRLELARAGLSAEPNGSGAQQEPAAWSSRAQHDIPVTRGERFPCNHQTPHQP